MTFTISFGGDIEMTVDEIWPDGDAPENPTAEDVIEKMKECGRKSALVDDWNLGDDIIIAVDGDGKQAEW